MRPSPVPLLLAALLLLVPALTPGGALASDLDPYETERHVLEFPEAVPDDLATTVADLGGVLLRVHPEIGVAVTSGLSDEAADELGARKGAKEWHRDLTLQLVPLMIGGESGFIELRPESQEGADAPEVQHHDPADASGFGIQWNMRQIEADHAWAAGFRGDPSVRVAIVDSGIDPYHVDTIGLIDEASSIAFTPSLNGPPDWSDDHFHGTSVGGTVVSNGIGTSGVAPHTTLIAVKVCSWQGRCTFSNTLAGILHAVDVGAHIINMSLAGFFQHAHNGFFNGLLNRTVAHANRSGVLVVAAAGNGGIDMQHPGNLLIWPCMVANVFCIGATRDGDTRAFYSNFGTNAVHVVAPGGRGFGPAREAHVATPCSTRSLVFTICKQNNLYVWVSGTSFSAPHVAGAAALLLAQEPGRTGDSLRTRLQASADDLGKEGADPLYGKGRINVCTLLDC
jgi:subtilisin family serine protease